MVNFVKTFQNILSAVRGQSLCVEQQFDLVISSMHDVLCLMNLSECKQKTSAAAPCSGALPSRPGT